MDLVQALTALIIAYLEQSYPVKELRAVLSSAIRLRLKALIPELADTFREYDAGTEINWNALADGLESFKARYVKQQGAKQSFVGVLNAYIRYFRKDSAPALKQIEKLTADMNDPFLRSYFSKEALDQGAISRSLRPIVKGLGGKGLGLTVDEAKVAKDADPEAYRQYLALRRDFVSSWKVPLANYVRNSGHETVPLREALSHLEKHGIQVDLPAGFIGRIDASGNWYTMQEERIAGGPPSKAMFPSVKMNPSYDGDESPWVFQAYRADGSPAGYAYTEAYQKNQAKQKFERVQEFDVEATRKKWLPLIRSFDENYPSQESVAAVVLEILYRSSNRIGTRPSADPRASGFGISTLLCAHFYPQSNGDIKFIYSGKAGVKTVTVLSPRSNTGKPDPIAKLVCDAVRALVEGKKPRDPIFTYTQKNGMFRIVQSGMIRMLFQRFAGVPGLSVHKLRTAAGSSLYRQYLDDLFAKKKSLTPQQVQEAWLKGAVLVAKRLNHVRRSAEGAQTAQPGTSLKSYIDPALQMELFLHYGAPIPKALEAITREADAEDRISASAGE